MAYVFSAPGQVVLPVVGSTDLFPVRRIYCVGRNYADHAIEMGHSGREAPFFFAKPADAVLAISPGKSATLAYPGQTDDLQYETELVVALGRGGANISAADAAGLVWGYAVGIDLTRRDLQSALKRQGRPWEISKGFDHSAPISAVRPVTKSGWLAGGRIWLDVNGQRRQDSDIACMIWGVNDIIEHLSRYFALAPGDLIFTGTPAGVAAVRPGDVLRAGIDGVGELTLAIGVSGP
jgi:fumarylpyruvate hydrolase